MSQGRSTVPDLDSLESPILSPSSVSGLGGVPGSAIAEKIFNDPHSWDDTSGDEGDYPEDIENDTLLWFADEIEKLRLQSAGADKRDSKETGLVPKREGNGGWKDIARRRGSVRPISLAGLFEPNDDFSKEIQQHLSKILDSGKFGPRSSLTPPYSSDSLNTPSTAGSISTPLTSTSTERSPSVYSTSASLSFLEYYGIYPDSPRLEGRKLSRKRTRRRSKDAATGFRSFSHIPPTETAPQSTPPRPPPGLGFSVPPGLITPSKRQDRPLPASLPHSRKNSDSQEGVGSGSESSPRSRPLPIATPPRATSVYEDTPHTGTSPFRIRRLPSIPSEPQTQVLSTPPSDQAISRQRTPPPQSTSSSFVSPSKSSAALPPFSFGSASQISMSLRTPSTARSPLGVPLGPRTRARSSDAGRPMQTIQPC